LVYVDLDLPVKQRTIEIDRTEIIGPIGRRACAAATQFHKRITDLSLNRSLVRHINKTKSKRMDNDRLTLKANSSKAYAGGTSPAALLQ
jgi:hypothetical protein